MNSKKRIGRPPRFGEWLLESFCSYDFLSTALWDLEEIYFRNRSKYGKFKSDALYYLQAISIIYHLYFKGKSHHSSNRVAMFKNNINLSIRGFKNEKTYSIINLLGLSTGLLVFLLITLYVRHELSFDNYHEHADRIYRVYKQDVGNVYMGTDRYAVVPTPLAYTIKSEFPEVEEVFRANSYQNTIVKAGDQHFLEANVHAADEGLFKMFSFEVLAGNKEDMLSDPSSVVISQSTAEKYFGAEDPMGKVIRFRDQYPFQVTGVIKDMPENSHFVMDVILNFQGLIEAIDGPRRMSNWNNSSYYAFVMLNEGADAEALQEKLPQIRAKYADDPIDEDGQESNYLLQPLREMHFTQELNFDIAPGVDAQSLYIYLGIAFMILIIACINYINLATARAINKTKEIGIRKVVGAQRSNLIAQFLSESGLLIFAALLLAVGALTLILPGFSVFVDQNITIDFSGFEFWLLILIVGVSMTLVSGIYPAIVFARFKPVTALKGKTAASGRGKGFRNALVVFQFVISCTLIFSAVILSKQLKFIQTMDTGYTRDQIIVMSARDPALRENLEVFKQEIGEIPGVVSVTSSNSLPNNISSNTGARWVGQKEDEEVILYTNVTDESFVDLYELEIVEGRNFDPSIPTDKSAVLLNESAVKELGWENPIGMQMMRWFGDTGRVVGVLKDFHQHSLHLKIEPIQIFNQSSQRLLSVKIDGDEVGNTIQTIEERYLSLNPTYPFDYNYFNDIFDRAYLREMNTAKLANWFTGLAILIACLGLYGLAAHKVQDRIKEVGVRKVLGASVSRILLLLSRDFVILLITAFFIAAPIAYYVMDNWLQGFAYHTDINLLTFVLTLILMILFAGATVSYRTYRAAVRNPVEALRDE